MHFDYSQEHEMLRDATRRHLEKEDPIRALRGAEPHARDARRDAWRSAAEQGWAAMMVGEDIGGTGGSLIEAMVVAEELGRGAFAGPFAAANAAACTIAEHARVAALVPAIAAGERIVAWAAFDAGAWDGSQVACRAAPAAGAWRIDGTFGLVQDADIADEILLAALDADGALAQYLVPADAPGVEIRPARTIDLTRRLCEVTLRGVSVPADRRLGGDARAAIDAQFRTALVLMSADSVGSAARLFDMTLEYTKVRVAFGQVIAAFQALKHRMADMLVQLETARTATWHAAVRVRDADPAMDEAASIAKFYTGGAAAAIAGQALQLHGGIGFTWEHDLHLFLKRIKANESLWGTGAWHRERVARLLRI